MNEYTEIEQFDTSVLVAEDPFDENDVIPYNDPAELEEDYFSDAWADGDTLASIGWGTDEDYGYDYPF